MTPSDNDPSGSAGVPPLLGQLSAGGVPPPIPRPARPARAGLGPLAIVAICVGALTVFLVLGLIGAALFLRSQAAVRQEAMARRAAAEVSDTQARAARTARATRAPASSVPSAPSMQAASSAQAAPSIQAAQPRPIKSEPGVSYMNDRIRGVPWSIHVLKIDRSRQDLGFYSAHAQRTVLGVSLLADQARAIPSAIGRAIGGVNGDFYERDNRTYAGDPRGIQIIDGELISGPSTVCVWFDGEGNPYLHAVKGDFQVTWPDGSKTPFGLNQRRAPDEAVLYTPTYGPSTRVTGGQELVLEHDGNGPWLPLGAGQTCKARVRDVQTAGNTPLAPGLMVLSIGPELLSGLPTAAPGTVLEISTATTPDLKAAKMAIAGGPALIQGGKRFSLTTPPPGTGNNYSERSKYERHPRSAMGWSATHVYLVSVDGRQPGLSMGMKLAELAEYMAALGCTEAMNFDGGKSAQMWLSGRIVNSPAQGEDTVANSLMVVRKPEP